MTTIKLRIVKRERKREKKTKNIYVYIFTYTLQCNLFKTKLNEYNIQLNGIRVMCGAVSYTCV